LIKIYNSGLNEVNKGEPAKNPLLKNKGKIMDDWSMPEEIFA
jgi:hypothetical protein